MSRPRIYLQSSLAGALLIPLGYLIGVRFGPLGLVHAWQVAAPVLLAITLALTLPVVGARLGELARALLPVGAATAAMALAVTLFDRVVAGAVPAPLHLALLVATGGVTYGAALLLGWPQVVRDTWAVLFRK